MNRVHLSLFVCAGAWYMHPRQLQIDVQVMFRWFLRSATVGMPGRGGSQDKANKYRNAGQVGYWSVDS